MIALCWLLVLPTKAAAQASTNQSEVVHHRGLGEAGSGGGIFDWIHRLSGPKIGLRGVFGISNGFTHLQPLRLGSAPTLARLHVASLDSIIQANRARIASRGVWSALDALLQPIDSCLALAGDIAPSLRMEYDAKTVAGLESDIRRLEDELHSLRNSIGGNTGIRVNGTPEEMYARACHAYNVARAMNTDLAYASPAKRLRWHARMAIGADSSGIEMVAFQGSVEWVVGAYSKVPVLRNLTIDAGPGVNVFYGDSISSFSAFSFTAVAGYYLLPRSRFIPLRPFRLNLGGTVFPFGFDRDDFLPAFRMEEDIGFEGVLTFGLSYELMLLDKR